MATEATIGHKQMILATQAKSLPPAYQRTGFYPLEASAAIDVLSAAGLWIGPREQLETDPAYRQAIPYILLRLNGRFVRYTRTKAGGEARLHDRISIGVGGHVDLSDIVSKGTGIDLESTLMSAANREVCEELGQVDCMSKDWIGILVDNDSDVGRVHVGIVGLWSLRSLPGVTAEEAIGEVALCSITELGEIREKLERWSELILDQFGCSVRRFSA
jgi:predicted NUDIX family phosphoesterase